MVLIWLYYRRSSIGRNEIENSCMIKGMYEIHLPVETWHAPLIFTKIYGSWIIVILKKKEGSLFLDRPTKEYMRGLWEKPKDEMEKNILPFVRRAGYAAPVRAWLKEKNLKPYNFLKDDIEQSMEFAWMPAIAIYFDHPDVNVLEFITVLPGEARPELGVISSNEWIKRK